MSTVTSPIMLDTTGQQMVTKLESLIQAVKPFQSTLRNVPIAIGISDWSGSGTSWTATFLSEYVTETCVFRVAMDDDSMELYAKNLSDFTYEKKSGGGGITFYANAKPSGTLIGKAYVLDNDDGKLPVIIESTVVGIENGGTGQSTLVGAKSVLGITELADHLANIIKVVTSGSLHDIKESGIYYVTGGVTDKPAVNGGMYIVSAYSSSLLIGLFTNTDGYTSTVVYNGGNWYTHFIQTT